MSKAWAYISESGVRHALRARRRAGNRGDWKWGLGAAILAISILIPLSIPLLSIFQAPLTSLRALLQNRIPRAVASTVILCATVSATTLFFGSTTAWILTRHQFRSARGLQLLLILPLTIPAYIHAYSLPDFVLRLPPLLVSWYTLSFSLAPYAFIICRFAFQHESRVLFDVAAIQGTKRPFLRLALPMTRPALIGVILLVSMEILNEYGVFVYLGAETVTTLLFRIWFGHYNISAAMQIAGYIMLIAILFAMLEGYSRRKIVYTQPHSALHYRPPYHALTRPRRLLLHIYCIIPIVCGFALPATSMLYWSTQAAWQVGELVRATAYSVGIALLAGIICLACGLFFAYSERITRGTVISTLTNWAAYGYSIPGVVIALSLLQVGGSAITAHLLLALLFAYLVRYLAVCYHPLRAALQQHCRRVDEAAQLLGASHWRRLWRVAMPQMRQPIGGVLVLMLFDILKDLPLTLILRPIGLETLALQSFLHASEERFSYAAPFAIAICCIGIVIVVVTQQIQRKHETIIMCR